MIFGFFNTTLPIDEPTIEWIFDGTAWFLRNLDAQFLFNESLLLTPTNRHFPGQQQDAHALAQLIFDQTLYYAGMRHWPLRLQPPGSCATGDHQRLTLQPPLRSAQLDHPNTPDTDWIDLSYDPQQLKNPQGLIATYAHTFAYLLGSQAKERPVGDEALWPHLVELAAVMLGFGIMLTNTAYIYRGGGCTSCNSGIPDRTSLLSPDELTYALALFCELKQIPTKQVLPHLKSSQHPLFKRARKDIEQREKKMERLQGYRSSRVLS